MSGTAEIAVGRLDELDDPILTRAFNRFKARGDRLIPRLACISWPAKIRHKKQIKMREMVSDIFRCQNNILRQAAIFRHGQIFRHCQRFGCGNGLGHRTNATNPRRKNKRILRMFAKQHPLKPAIERGDDPRISHHPILNVQLNL